MKYLLNVLICLLLVISGCDKNKTRSDQPPVLKNPEIHRIISNEKENKDPVIKSEEKPQKVKKNENDFMSNNPRIKKAIENNSIKLFKNEKEEKTSSEKNELNKEICEEGICLIDKNNPFSLKKEDFSEYWPKKNIEKKTEDPNKLKEITTEFGTFFPY